MMFSGLDSVNFIDEISSLFCNAICSSFLPCLYSNNVIGFYCHFYSSENNAEKTVTVTKNRILASCCSDSGKYFAVCDDFKQLHLYRFDADWKIISQR